MNIEYLVYAKRLAILRSINDGMFCLAYICRLNQLGYSSASEVVSEFEKSGLLIRRQDWGKREVKLLLTKSGIELLDRLEEINILILGNDKYESNRNI